MEADPPPRKGEWRRSGKGESGAREGERSLPPASSACCCRSPVAARRAAAASEPLSHRSVERDEDAAGCSRGSAEWLNRERERFGYSAEPEKKNE